jgi:serine/threonine-protein kinase
MMTAELGACEWFVWDLRRSNLVERGRLDQLVGDFLAQRPQAEPAELADFLVEQSILTRFQADSLLAGKNQGLVLGPYVVSDTLGAGSMGTVYKACSKANNEWYAVKVLPRRSMWNIRLARRKVRDFEQLRHPAIVPFVDVGTSGSMHYLVWPLVEGETLSKVVENQGALPPADAALIALQTAEGLEVAHQRNIIHGLLKPSNIMISSDRQVHILDFGIGALLAETENESVVDTMSTANTMASGLDCASPEGIMDPTQMTAASDQYSLGCVLYFCLTGQVPFPGNNAVEKMMAHQSKQPTPVKELAPNVPDDMAAVVEKLMQKNPHNRYGSIADVILELRPFAEEAGGSMFRRRPTPLPPTSRRLSMTPPPPRPASSLKQPSPVMQLPDRRSMDKPAAATPGHPGSGIRQPGPGGPRPSSIQRPSVKQLPGGPDDKGKPAEEKVSLLLIVGLGLIACVVGWLMAGWFQ